MSLTVDGRLVAGHGEAESEQPGAFWWGTDGGQNVLLYTCPCGCGTPGALNVGEPRTPPKWEWDGNREKPTLTPSIRRTAGCMWHGFLRRGVWVWA